MSRYKKSKLPKQSRTIPRRGNKDRGARSAGSVGEDFRKYYRCWHCGFVCNEDRDAVGGISSGNGIEIKEYSIPLYSGFVSLGNGALTNIFVIGDSTNINEEVKNNFKPDVGSGCPFCGTLNWRGDY